MDYFERILAYLEANGTVDPVNNISFNCVDSGGHLEIPVWNYEIDQPSVEDLNLIDADTIYGIKKQLFKRDNNSRLNFLSFMSGQSIDSIIINLENNYGKEPRIWVI